MPERFPTRRRPIPARKPRLEVLEPRYTPAGQATNVVLPIEGFETVATAALLPEGELRWGGEQLSILGTVWDFDRDGNPLRETRLGLAPGRTHASVQATSPNGRWLAGMQFDLNYADEDFGSAFGLWDGDHPESFQEIDILSISPLRSGRILDISDTGVVILQVANLLNYRWGATNGFQRLVSLYELEGDSSAEGQQAESLAISQDGSTIVGVSGYTLARRPTIWTAAGPQELPTDGSPGAATAVSADGQIVGGRLQEGTVWRPVVWANGELIELKTAQGELAAGQLTAVVNGLGDDPNRWVAFGGSEQQAWIAFADGIVRPFEPWLKDHFDLDFTPAAGPLSHGYDSPGHGSGVLDAFLRDGALHIAAHEWAMTVMTDSIPPSIFYAPTRPHWIVIPLRASGDPDAEAPYELSSPYDVNQDGHISPLDALLVIDALNAQSQSGSSPHPLGRLDINNDAGLTPADALAIIDYLNQQSAPVNSAVGPMYVVDDQYTHEESDPEGLTPRPAEEILPTDDLALWALLAADLAEEASDDADRRNGGGSR